MCREILRQEKISNDFILLLSLIGNSYVILTDRNNFLSPYRSDFLYHSIAQPRNYEQILKGLQLPT